MKLFFSFILSLLPLFSFVWGERKMEAKVYFLTADELIGKLGTYFSELDVATFGETEAGEPYIVILTTEEELDVIREKGLRVEITYPDIKEKFRLMTGVDPDRPELLRDFGYFFTYWEVQDTINRMKANYPMICTIMNIGNSHQGRPLWTLKISDNPTVDEPEPAVYFNGATHGREPGSTHCCIDFAGWLLVNYALDSTVRWLIDNREIYITPVMNPDGYVYNSDSGGATANWRKNRRVVVSPHIGVDLNRNYGFKWGYDNIGSSPFPGSEIYRGPSRFSEPETRAARDFMLTQRIRAQIDYHTYGRYNMFPWGYARIWPPDTAVLREMIDTFRMYNGYPRNGQISRVLYTANGNSVDWEYADTLHEGNQKFITYALVVEWGINDFWYGWNNPTYVDNENRLNRPNNYYLTRVGGVFFEKRGAFINDTLSGNRTGQLDPGETAYVWFKFRNRAINPVDSAYGISGVVRSSDLRVTMVDSTFTIPTVRRKDTANTRSVMLRIAAATEIPPNTQVNLRVIVSYLNDGFAMSQPLDYAITIGATVGVAERKETPLPYFQNPSGNFREALFNITGDEDLTLRIIGADGRVIREGGIKSVADGLALREGIYFLELRRGSEREIRKLVVIR